MFTWVTSNPAQDPLFDDISQQNLINFCGTHQVNQLFLDMYNYLGDGNYNDIKLARLRQFLDVAHRSGIQVHALAGNSDWAINQSWVQTNVVRNIKFFNNQGQDREKFDGVMLDVEYWVDPNQQASTSCPKLCDLIRSIKKTLQVSVGCFASFYLKDSTGARPSFSYQGKTAQDGEFLMDNADYVIVGAYRNHAEDNFSDGPGQKTLFQPWYAYASQVNKNMGLYCGSETNPSPENPYLTYFGSSQTYMEQQHTLISNQFTASDQSVFLGQAIENYDGWKVMPS
jgi:hypothetical protein